MKNWTEAFISRCLTGVPEGKYRARTEKELGDHLETLRRDLEEAGRAPEEARTAALAQMGDPAELARGYVREWRRRVLLRRGLATAELILFAACVSVVGLLYIANARNFGKEIVSWWGIVAIVAAQFMVQSSYRIFNKTWVPTRLACLVLTVIQLPPVVCWTFTTILWDSFEFTGVMMVPGWLGLSIHLLFLLWGKLNYRLFTRFQQEDDCLIQTRQSA